METLRELKITIELDTNKNGIKEVMVLGEHNEEETVKEFKQRINKKLDKMFNFLS